MIKGNFDLQHQLIQRPQGFSPVREQAEVTGEIQVKQLTGRQVVVAEGWPTWTSTLLASGCQNVMVASTNFDGKAWLATDLDFFESVFGTSVLAFNMDSMAQLLGHRHGCSQAWWLQGSYLFVQNIVAKINAFRPQIGDITMIFTGRPRNQQRPLLLDRKITWHRVQHAALGGITLSTWEFGSTAAYDRVIFRQNPIRRSLGDILDCTQKGIICSEPQDDDSLLSRKRHLNHVSDSQSKQLWLNKTSLLPWGHHEINVIAPSVFSRSGFCKRRLSDHELFHAYDLQMNQIERISDGGPQLCSDHLGFVHAAPEKVLMCGFSAVANTWFSPHTASVATSSSASLSSSIALLEYANDSDDGDDSWDQNAKAVKSDDATAHVDMWDAYSVRSFVLEDHRLCFENLGFDFSSFALAQPRVCLATSTSLQPAHTQLFVQLRVIGLRWYRLKVVSSFKKFLKQKYGHDVLLLWANRTQLHWDCQPPSSASSIVVGEFGTQLLPLSRPWWTELELDVSVGGDALRRALNADWWDWTFGSTPLFWRWPRERQRELRDGLRSCIKFDKLPNYWARQLYPSDPLHREKLIKKVSKVVAPTRGYVTKGLVKSLTGFFAVPKGVDDIRVVYDATKCGLNNALWSANFWLPTIDTILRNSSLDAWYGDIDLGEMFLNYPLDPRLRPYAGIDVTAVLNPTLSDAELRQCKREVQRWGRCAMGLTTSPILCTKAFAWSEEMIRGDRLCVSNCLGWDIVHLNLPGSASYNPSLPYAYRVDSKTGQIAGYFGTYVDDIRPVGNTEKHCWRIARRVASVANYLGQQDAPRKRRRITQTPGAWAGALIKAKEENLYVTTSQEKWDKCKNFLQRWQREIESTGSGIPLLQHKDLQKGRGHLVYLCRTYPSATPFLKGIHHTLESWRPGRDGDGWKFNTSQWKAFLKDLGSDMDGDLAWTEVKRRYVEKFNTDPPQEVSPVKRLATDIGTLLMLMRSKKPPLRLVRGKSITKVKYGFGDAAGSGFGSVWQSKEGLSYRYGVWGDDMQGSSSNFRELTNLVESLEVMHMDGSLNGTEIFFFTDNATAERAFFKGNSSSLLLHGLVTRLRDLEMNGGCIIRLCHVSGKRMIAQGADGLSRGNLSEGVMSHGNIMQDVPLHLSCLDRENNIRDWLKTWVMLDRGEEIEYLSPEDWFERGHDLLREGSANIDGRWEPRHKAGIFVWTPAPAVADVVLEQIRQARHKRQESTHIFLCPRLFEPYWKGPLFKSADIVFEVPASTSFWPASSFEPLVVGLYFPFLRVEPWQLKGSQALLAVGKQLRQLWKTGEITAGALLCKLWTMQRKLASMPRGMVCKMLSSFSCNDLPCEPPVKRRRIGMESQQGQGSVHDS